MKRPERFGSMTDMSLLSMRSIVTGLDHRYDRFRHKKVIDSINMQQRQGLPISKCLKKLVFEAQRIVDDEVKLSDDETKLFVAAIAECQLRLVLEAEIEIASALYWDALFWQDRIKSPILAWLESGPFTWFQNEEEALTPEDKLDNLQRLLNQINTGTGLIQQHLTRKIVNTDVGYLGAWSNEALDLIDDILNDVMASDRVALASAMMLPTRSDPDLKECLGRVHKLQSAIHERKERFEGITRPLQSPSFWRRRWLYVVIASPLILFSLRWIWNQRENIPKWFTRAVDTTRDFFSEHVYEPSRAIAKELIFNEHESITDVAALQDAKTSLVRMLEDFIKDNYPKMTDDERRSLAESMDMSVVSDRYGAALPQAIKNVVTGDIVRMLLIQVQFIKKELLVAMKSIDELIDSNSLNFRFMATVPAVAAVYFIYQLCKLVTYKTTRRKGRRETILMLRSFLLSIERLLNLRNVAASEDDIKYLKLEGGRLVHRKPSHHHQQQHSSLNSYVGRLSSVDSHPVLGVHSNTETPTPPVVLAEEGRLGGAPLRYQTPPAKPSSSSLTSTNTSDDGHEGGRDTPGELPLPHPIPFPGSVTRGVTNASWEQEMVGGGGGRGANGGGVGAAAELQVVFLKAEDLGTILLFVTQFSTLIERTSKRFLTEIELGNLLEDLNEMTGNCGPVTVTQQLCIVQRMYRSYRFLQIPVTSIFSSF